MRIANTQSSQLKPASGTNSVQNMAQTSASSDCFIKFKGDNSKPESETKNSFWKSPGLKIMGGGALLATGIGLKVFGWATVIGAPLLLPIGIGLALTGTGLGVWGVVQACYSESTPAEPPKPKTPDFKDRTLSQAEKKLILGLAYDLTHPVKDYIESAQKTLKDLNLSDDSINELQTAFKEFRNETDTDKMQIAKLKAVELLEKAQNHIRDYNSSEEVIEKVVAHQLKFESSTVEPLTPFPTIFPIFIPTDGS